MGGIYILLINLKDITDKKFNDDMRKSSEGETAIVREKLDMPDS